MNEVLRWALADARLTDADIARRLDVDPKTVRRWLSGQRPHPRHRWGVADLVGVSEHDLWPEPATPNPQPPAGAELRAVYPHRWAVPHDAWRHLFGSAEREIGILVYSGLFLADDPGILRILERKARAGVTVCILLGDPDSPQVEQRGIEEGIGDAMAAKIRNALVLYRPLLDVEGVELRLHRTVLYNSLYRADDQLLVNQHVYGVPAAATPVFHIHGSANTGMAATYAESFERIWETAAEHRASRHQPCR